MRIALSLLVILFGVQLGQAAYATINTMLEKEAIEICHREGGTDQECGTMAELGQ
mgnify:CR=1 FL=1